MRQQTVESLLSAHLAPPSPEELAARFKVQPKVLDEEIRALVNEGVLVRVSKDLVFHEAPLTEFRTRVEQHFATRETLDAQGLKELTGVSRKFSIPLGEWLDRAKVTVRVGDIRRRRTVV